MTSSIDSISIFHAEMLAELFATSAVLRYQLPGFVTARLPKAARHCDAIALARLCDQNPKAIEKYLERLDQKTATWQGRQPFRADAILSLVRALGGANKGDGIEAMLPRSSTSALV